MSEPTLSKTRLPKLATPGRSAETSFDVQAARADFPILSKEIYGKPLVYLDNAASAQKPNAVLDCINEVYSSEYSNVHRGLHYLSNAATTRFEEARTQVAKFLNAPSDNEIIFTRGATEAINLAAASFGGGALDIGEGDEIILSVMEHHSNIVPWHFLRERKGAVLKWVPITDQGDLDMEAYAAAFGPRTKLVAITHMSNALGSITPIKEIIRLAHERDVPVLVDGCQSAVHMPIDVQEMDCDFFTFSGHKLYGPTGIGVLYGKPEHLKAMPPYQGGGEMIGEVELDRITYADPPQRFEAGTPAIVQAIGLGAAVTYLMGLDRPAVAAHEDALVRYAHERLDAIDGIRIIGTSETKGSIVSFVLDGAHAHDVGTILDRSGVAVRAGHHCAQTVMARYGVPATARASFALYNTLEEVDALAEAIENCKRMFG